MRPLDIHVNGSERSVPAGTTVGALLAELGVEPEGVAVALDREVVPRSQLKDRPVPDGCRVEIIRAVGGG